MSKWHLTLTHLYLYPALMVCANLRRSNLSECNLQADAGIQRGSELCMHWEPQLAASFVHICTYYVPLQRCHPSPNDIYRQSDANFYRSFCSSPSWDVTSCTCHNRFAKLFQVRTREKIGLSFVLSEMRQSHAHDYLGTDAHEPILCAVCNKVFSPHSAQDSQDILNKASLLVTWGQNSDLDSAKLCEVWKVMYCSWPLSGIRLPQIRAFNFFFKRHSTFS